MTVKVYEDRSHEIVAIEEYSPTSLDSQAGVEFYDGILCAGFINTHSHLELAYLRGAIAEGEGFAAFADSMARVRNNFSEQEQLSAIAKADEEMWQEGVDAVGDIVNGSTSFATKATSRILYHNFAEVFGLRRCNLEEQKRLLQEPNTTLTPHSTYSVTDAVFKEVCSTTSQSPLSIHFLETEDENLLYNGKGRLHEWYSQVGFECDFLGYGSPAKRIVASIPPQRSVILVHNTALSPSDVEILSDHFTAPIYWALCPRSNEYISRQKPQSVELLRAGAKNICIGTDSLASNRSLSMVEELKMFRNIPLAELLTWATLNGAKALGIDDDYGTIEVGKKCGIVNISGVDLSNLSLTPNSHAKRIL